MTAFNPEQGLQVALSNATDGVTLTTPGAASATVATHELLRDASVDFETGETPTVYGSVLNENGAVSGFATKASPYLAGTKSDGNTKYYYANSYTATFSLTSGTGGKTYALFYDSGETTATSESAIKDGLRIGVYFSKTNYFVIAPFKASGTVSYVNGTGASATANYSKVVYSADNCSSIGGTVTLAGAGAVTGYMGTLTSSENLTPTIFTWFEGTDAATINNNADNQGCTVTLGFRIVEVIEA